MSRSSRPPSPSVWSASPITHSSVVSRFETRAKPSLLARYVQSIPHLWVFAHSLCAQITKIIEGDMDEAAEGVANMSVAA